MFSKSLYSNVAVNVILPTPNAGMEPMSDNTEYPKAGQKYPVLYLLHGFSADYTDWLRGSGIERYAQAARLAVVMPSAGNSFYKDLPNGAAYATFILDELPEFVQSVFPVSDQRAHNYIAGISMGGYGAVVSALRRPGQYAAMAGLSGMLGNLVEGLGAGPLPDSGMPAGPYLYLEHAFGKNFERYDPETDDIPTLLQKAADAGEPIPRLYQCCGTEDLLYGSNIEFRRFAETLNIDYTYEEGPGMHDFDFWDPFIARVIQWLAPDGGFVA
jgi:S-formylglutathione hydrolase FrmB